MSNNASKNKASAAAKTTTEAGKTTKTRQSRASDKKSVGADGVVVIKKYPNRRLYDTSTSAYITLADIKEMVVRFAPFVVQDAKTGEDLTRSILLQIILEEESASGAPLFTADTLANIIRFYGHAMQSVMGRYMEKNFQALMEMQSRFNHHRAAFTPEVWANLMQPQSGLMQNWLGSYAEQSAQLMAKMQENLLTAFVPKK